MSVLTHWPSDYTCLSAAERRQAVSAVEAAFSSTLETLKVDIGLVEMLEAIYVPLAAWIYAHRQQRKGPLIVGINGAQGAGKSTLFNLLEVTLSQGFSQRVVGFSLDDIYKTRAERLQMAKDIHPLFETRGVPGTHEVQLGIDILNQLKQAGDQQVTRIPVFDKSIDDRCPEVVWQEWIGPADVVVLDGWCLGAAPQTVSQLVEPVNELEAADDAQGLWRDYVNTQLAGPYAELFGMVDLLLMLKVPSMDSVYEWRMLQEKKLADRARFLARTQPGAEPLRIMSEDQIRRFIMHYERLTRDMLETVPARADATLCLNRNHKIDRIIVQGDRPCCD